MGLAKRVIPTILCRGRQLVKGKQFNSWRSVGVAAQAVRVHQTRGVDELVLLDIAATPEGRGPDLDLVRELSEVCFMPLAVGGGIKSLADVKALLHAGADKVVIGAAALQRPELIGEISSVVGSQAVVFAFNYFNCCGPQDAYPLGGIRIARAAEDEGAGEILLTSMEREGMMDGYDLPTLKAICEAVSVPVIAHGGCGTYQHMLEAIEAGAAAVAAGAMFQFTDATPRGAAAYLATHGIEARV